ncbi:MAG TPA: hypothetical protein VD886_11185 [Herpetosiphonaceae bacterium]|nr:hypothetical protein [Herpetosiphonaceae bacterium]
MSYGPPNDPQSGQQPPQGYQQPPQAPPPGYQQPPQGYQPPPTAYGQGYQVPSAQNVAAGFQGFSLGRKLVLGGGLAAFIFFFLPWYKVSFLGETLASASGLRGFPFVAWLLVLAVTVAMALPLFGRRLSSIVPLPLSDGQVGLYGGGAALVISLLGALLYTGDGIGLAWGFFLALLAQAAMAAGGWLMFQAKE